MTAISLQRAIDAQRLMGDRIVKSTDRAALRQAEAQRLERLYGLCGDLRFLKAAEVLQKAAKRRGRRPVDDSPYAWRVHVLVETTGISAWVAAGKVAMQIHRTDRSTQFESIRKRLRAAYERTRSSLPAPEAAAGELHVGMSAVIVRGA